MPHSCAVLGGFAIGARVALLWQNYGNAWQNPAVMPHTHTTTVVHSDMHTCEQFLQLTVGF